MYPHGPPIAAIADLKYPKLQKSPTPQFNKKSSQPQDQIFCQPQFRQSLHQNSALQPQIVEIFPVGKSEIVVGF